MNKLHKDIMKNYTKEYKQEKYIGNVKTKIDIAYFKHEMDSCGLLKCLPKKSFNY